MADPGIRLLASTQTPLVRFFDDAVARLPAGRSARLADLRESEDYKFTTGGVTRMLFPLLRRWIGEGRVAAAEWVALAAGERAPRVLHDGVGLSFVGMAHPDRGEYALAKEHLWALLNATDGTSIPPPPGPGAWRALEQYQTSCARALETAARELGGADLLYVHDFQQLGVARAWPGSRVPRVFHLHTPFPAYLADGAGRWVVDRLSDHDAVIVSTTRYAENLKRAGLDRPIHVIPPFVDPDQQRDPPYATIERFRERFGVPDGAPVVLNVARMDPMKGQDRLLRAMPALVRLVPAARLVLVGNGSFSSARTGLGLTKGARWRAGLEALADELGIADRVVFTGHLADQELAAAYAACDAFCLPSTREGFGLAAIEAWLHGKPVVVSNRAGVADLVTDGVDGYALDCSRPDALAGRLAALLADPAASRRMGESGRETGQASTLPRGATALWRTFRAVIDEEVSTRALA